MVPMITRREFVQGAGAAALLPDAIANARMGRGAIAGASWQLPSGHYLAANFPLQIIAPRAGLTAANRYYTAYPGIPFVVPVAVIGGAWPFLYQLTSAPSGMTIGQQYGQANYGIITWENPVAGSYSLEVTVTDQQGNSQSVSWTLTVQTSGFLFVDSVDGNASVPNGGTGTGTISNPFKTMNDWYAGATGGDGENTQSDTTYVGYFVYYRGNNGNTYSFDTCYYPSSGQVYMDGKPVVHMAYPGDASPTFDVVTNGISWYMPDDNKDVFIQGVTFNGAPTTSTTPNCLQWDSGVTDIGIFQCTFQEPSTASVEGINCALLYSDDNSPNVTQYLSFIGNTIEGLNGYDAFLAYSTEYCLFENNTCNGINGAVASGCFYAKDSGNSYWTVRNNTGLTGNTATFGTQSLVLISDFSTVQYVEIVWNNFASTGSGVYLEIGNGGSVSDIYLGRNTWQIDAHAITGSNLTGAIYITDDVNQFTDSAANSHGWYSPGGYVLSDATYAGEECVGLNGNFVNSGGDLVSPYTEYFGERGWQVG